MPNHNPNVDGIVGQIRRFGPIGPTYKILSVAQYIDEFDAFLKIQIIETGEEVEYRYTHAMDDPKEN